MTTGQVEDFATVDVFHFEIGLFGVGNSIFLQAYLGDLLVASDSVFLSTIGIGHDILTISDVNFDTLRLAGEGPNQNGIFIGAIDNVVITPEPSALVLLGLSSLLVLRKRRFCKQTLKSGRWRASSYVFAVGAFWFSVPSASAQCTGPFDFAVDDIDVTVFNDDIFAIFGQVAQE